MSEKRDLPNVIRQSMLQLSPNMHVSQKIYRVKGVREVTLHHRRVFPIPNPNQRVESFLKLGIS